MIKYDTISEAMNSPEGKALYKILSQSFDEAKAMSPKAVNESIDQNMTYLGSQKHLEKLVWQILMKETPTANQRKLEDAVKEYENLKIETYGKSFPGPVKK